MKEKYWDRELFSPKAINSNGVYLYNFTSKEKILPIDPAPKKWEFYCVTDRGEQISRPIGNPFDFLDDNPDMGMDDVRHFWALKRALPSEDGRHRYHRSDLDLRP